MRIFIVGTGGVGGFFGGKLAKAGNDVTFVTRGESYNAIKSNGLIVKSVDGDFEIKPVKVLDSISKITDPDLIIVTVKTYDTEEISKQLDKVVLDKTQIITFQNGVENDKIIAKHISKGTVYPGIAYVISSREAAGIIRQTGGLKRLVIGNRIASSNEELRQVLNIFQASGIDSMISENIEIDLWKKFIFVNAFSGFTALCRSSIGQIREDAFVFELYKNCIKESITVAEKLNIQIPQTVYDDVLKLTYDTAPDSKSSLLIDIENKRRNEIETINGTLVKLANELALSVPVNEMIYAALKLT